MAVDGEDHVAGGISVDFVAEGVAYVVGFLDKVVEGAVDAEEPVEKIEPASLEDDAPTAIEQVDAIERRQAGAIGTAGASSTPWSRFIGHFKPAKRIPLPLTKSVEDDDATPTIDDSDDIVGDNF